MKIITFDGRVGANGVEVKTSKNGTVYASFSVANNSFSNGEENTEWFDITVFDPNFIEKRASTITKGTYVIITGHLKSKMNVDKTGKVWINHYVTAVTIDTPRFGVKNDNAANTATNTTATVHPTVSTFTGATNSNRIMETMNTSVAGDTTVKVTPVTVPTVVPAVAGVGVNNDTDDLPF